MVSPQASPPPRWRAAGQAWRPERARRKPLSSALLLTLAVPGPVRHAPAHTLPGRPVPHRARRAASAVHSATGRPPPARIWLDADSYAHTREHAHHLPGHPTKYCLTGSDLYQSGSPPEGPIPPYPAEAASPAHSGLSRSTEWNTDSLADRRPHRSVAAHPWNPRVTGHRRGAYGTHHA
jgi:hypothetical protein